MKKTSVYPSKTHLLGSIHDTHQLLNLSKVSHSSDQVELGQVRFSLLITLSFQSGSQIKFGLNIVRNPIQFRQRQVRFKIQVSRIHYFYLTIDYSNGKQKSRAMLMIQSLTYLSNTNLHDNKQSYCDYSNPLIIKNDCNERNE